MTAPAVVIGAGLGGLTCALRLAAAGRAVEIIEAATAPGGRAGIWSESGFTVDTGPSVLTLPGLIEDVFEATGARARDYLDLVPLDPIYAARFADGSSLSVRADPGHMLDEVRAVCGPDEAARFQKLVAWLTDLYRLEWPHFIDRNFAGLFDYARIGPLVRLSMLGGLRKLYPAVSRFVQDDRLRRLFSFQAMYAGMSPFQALAIYAVIAYMDCVAGVHYPRGGGLHAVARALAVRAEEIGVKIRYNTPVARVLADSDGVTGVRLGSGETVATRSVVVNPDLPWAYEHLLADQRPPRRLARMKYSPSAWVMLAGVRGEVARTHHTIHFGEDYRRAFRELIDEKREMTDPSVLVSVPSVTDRALAPAGGSAVYYLVPVPSLPSKLDWAPARAREFRDRQVAHLERLGYVGFGDRVVVERTTTPLDWLSMGMARGTPFSLSHQFFQTGLFRPPNADPRVPGLFFTGSGTVPGVGVPMVIVSGRLAAERVLAFDGSGGSAAT